MIKKPKQRGLASALHKSAGFTLLELLIAVSIFAAAVVMIVGSFGLSTKNQRTVRANRDVSQGNRFSIDEIAKQIEFSYNGPLKNPRGALITSGRENVYNFAILLAPGLPQAETSGEVLFLRGADNHCRYYARVKYSNDPPKYKLAVYIDRDVGCGEGVLGPRNYEGPYYLTDENTNVKALNFQGLINSHSLDEQAYVKIKVDLENSDQSEFALPMLSKTVATIRNYGREN